MTIVSKEVVIATGAPDFSEAPGAKDDILKLTAVTFWNLHSGLCLLDQGDIILSDQDAQDLQKYVHTGIQPSYGYLIVADGGQRA